MKWWRGQAGFLELFRAHRTGVAANAVLRSETRLVDARDLNDAIQIAAKIPPAREGSVEVRPVRELVV